MISSESYPSAPSTFPVRTRGAVICSVGAVGQCLGGSAGGGGMMVCGGGGKWAFEDTVRMLLRVVSLVIGSTGTCA